MTMTTAQFCRHDVMLLSKLKRVNLVVHSGEMVHGAWPVKLGLLTRGKNWIFGIENETALGGETSINYQS